MEEDNRVSLEEALGNAILDKIEQLGQFEPGSKESTAVTKDIAVMYAELTKANEAGLKVAEVNARFDLEERKFEEEMKLKKKQLELEKQKFEEEKAKTEAEKKDKIVDWIFKGVGITGAGIGLMLKLGFFDGWFTKSFVFEEKGSITGTTSRNIWNQALKLLKMDK